MGAEMGLISGTALQCGTAAALTLCRTPIHIAGTLLYIKLSRYHNMSTCVILHKAFSHHYQGGNTVNSIFIAKTYILPIPGRRIQCREKKERVSLCKTRVDWCMEQRALQAIDSFHNLWTHCRARAYQLYKLTVYSITQLYNTGVGWDQMGEKQCNARITLACARWWVCARKCGASHMALSWWDRANKAEWPILSWPSAGSWLGQQVSTEQWTVWLHCTSLTEVESCIMALKWLK